MKPTLNEKFLAYLALFSGLAITVVAEYYSILGLTAIFSAAVIPVIIMGIALGLGKITSTVWLKQNWSIAPWSIRVYLLSAIAVLMLITSMGIFGFLSKAHSDQSLVSGDVQAKIAVYDEKIKTEKENIEAARKALKQMDDSVDQVLGRSTTETGADKAVSIRRSQQKERARLQADILQSQKSIQELNAARAPIAAEVRKVEAEVGPIKYIAQFVYGETNEGILEKAVTWVIIVLIIVFDPLAVILLLSSQISFQNFRERSKEEIDWQSRTDELLDVFEEEFAEGDSPEKESDVVSTATVTEPIVAQEVAEVIPEAVLVDDEPRVSVDPHPVGWAFSPMGTTPPVPDEVIVESPNAPGLDASVERPGDYLTPTDQPVRTVITGNRAQPRTKIFRAPIKPIADITEETVQEELQQEASHTVTHMGNGYVQVDGQMYHEGSIPPHIQGYIQNEEQRESGVWSQVKKNEE